MSDFARSERLVELRKARHISREKLANEVGVSTKAVYSWENGGGIRWRNAQALGTFYGVDPESLVSRDPDDAEVSLPGPDVSQLDVIEAKLDDVLAMLKRLEGDRLPGPPDELLQPPSTQQPKTGTSRRAKTRPAAGSR